MSAISRSSTFSMMLGRLYLVTMVILLLLFSGCFGCMTKMLLGFSLMGCRFFVQSLFSLAFEHSLHIALNYCVFPAGMDSFIDGFIVAFFYVFLSLPRRLMPTVLYHESGSDYLVFYFISKIL